jgi:hypothetical protein
MNKIPILMLYSPDFYDDQRFWTRKTWSLKGMLLTVLANQIPQAGELPALLG